MDILIISFHLFKIIKFSFFGFFNIINKVWLLNFFLLFFIWSSCGYLLDGLSFIFSLLMLWSILLSFIIIWIHSFLFCFILILFDWLDIHVCNINFFIIKVFINFLDSNQFWKRILQDGSADFTYFKTFDILLDIFFLFDNLFMLDTKWINLLFKFIDNFVEPLLIFLHSMIFTLKILYDDVSCCKFCL